MVEGALEAGPVVGFNDGESLGAALEGAGDGAVDGDGDGSAVGCPLGEVDGDLDGADDERPPLAELGLAEGAHVASGRKSPGQPLAVTSTHMSAHCKGQGAFWVSERRAAVWAKRSRQRTYLVNTELVAGSARRRKRRCAP